MIGLGFKIQPQSRGYSAIAPQTTAPIVINDH